MANPKGVIVGVDMGGTSLRALVVDAVNRILAVEEIPTRVGQKPEAIVADVAAMVRRAVARAGMKRAHIRAVSIGVPGAVDPQRGIVHAAPNLGWKSFPFGSKLKALLRVPIFVENDVNVGVVGEHALGAGKGCRELVGIFPGTGIGGGLIVGGKLYEGCRGSAGEVGHMILLAGGPRCGCGRRGCAEALASRTAMERDVRAAIKAGQPSVVLKIMKERGRERMTSSIINRALKKKDLVMRKVLKRAQYYLGLLVANVVNLLDPECVVIGGGIAERLGEDYVKPIRETAFEYFLNPRDKTRIKIVAGRLGDDAAPLGAVVLARQRLRERTRQAQ
jgi:glucokinase